MGLSERLLVGLSAESSPLPPQIMPGRVRGLRRSQLVDLVRRIGGEEAERLQARERELELRELAALEQLAELESELQLARERIAELEESQSNTARYELPRLADLINDEQSRSEALSAELKALKVERDALALRVAELEAGTAAAAADADLEAAAAVFAEGPDPARQPASDDVLSATAEFFGEGSELLEDEEVRALLAEAGLEDDASPAAKAEALLGADASDELSRAAQALLGVVVGQDGEPHDDTTRNFGSARDEAKAAAEDDDASSEGDELTNQVRLSDLERALISASSEAAAANRRAEELSERLAAGDEERQELLAQIQRLRDNLSAATQSREVDQLRSGHQTQRLKAPLVGRPELPGIVTDESGHLDLDHLLGAYVKAEERAARIDILEEVVWRLESGKPSSEAWRRALEQVRRACAHEQTAREEATRALATSETRRIELEAQLRSGEDERAQAQLELHTLMARYSSLEEGLQRAREELEAGRKALAEAREDADDAGQAWSQAEDELVEVAPSVLTDVADALQTDLEEELVGVREAYDALCAAHEDLREAHLETLDEIELLNEEQTELEDELEHADLEVQRLELTIVAEGLAIPAPLPRVEEVLVQDAVEILAAAELEDAELAAAELEDTLPLLPGEVPRPEIVLPTISESESSPTDLFDSPPLSEASPREEVLALRAALAEQSQAAENYERARRAFHEAQAQRDEAFSESARLRTHLAESRQAEAAWVWSAAASEAVLEDRLAAAEALRERLAAVQQHPSEAEDSRSERSTVDGSALLEASRGLGDQVETFAGLDPEEAREALAQSEAALAELEAVLLQLGASAETLASSPGQVLGQASPALGEPGGLEERVAQLELELAAARGRAGGAQDVAAGLRDRLREEHTLREGLTSELASARDRAESLRAELSVARESGSEPSAAAALASAQAELGEVLARLGRLEEGEHQAAAARDLLREEVREATEARRAAEEELQRALGERDLARSDTAAAPAPPEGLSESERVLHEVFQAELGGALGELELTQAELEATQAELEASEAELDMLRTELGLAQARVASAEEASQAVERFQEAERAAAEAAIDETRVLEGEADLAQALSERDAAQSALAAREVKFEAQAAELVERDRLLAERGDALDQLLSAASVREDRAAAVVAALKERDAELAAERAAQLAASETLAERDAEVAGAAAVSAALQETVAALKARLSASEREGSETEATLTQDLDTAQERIADADESLAAARAKTLALKEELEAAQAAQVAAERTAAVRQAELEASQAERAAAQAEHDAALAEANSASRQVESEALTALRGSLQEARSRVEALEGERGSARAEQARLETLLETHQAVQGGLEARAREAEARVRTAQAEAQGSEQEVVKLEAVLAAQRSVQEGLERRLREREQDAEEQITLAAQVGRVEALEVALAAERTRSADLIAAAENSDGDLESLRGEMSEAVAARATTEVEIESLNANLSRALEERDEAESTVARLLAEVAKAAADPITDVLDHPDLPESAMLSAARVGSEESSEELDRARNEIEDLRLLLSEQEQLSFAMRSELVELQAHQASGYVAEDEVTEDAPATDLESSVEALEEELAAREVRATRLESERARLSDEVYDLGRLLESECWRGLATHRDLVRAHQSLRALEERAGTSSGPTQEGSADQVLAEARRSLVAEGPPTEGDEDDELRQQAVAWLLTQAPQRADALAESSALLPEIEESLREESEALLHMRQEFRGRRQGLLEDLLTAERAVRNATDVGVQTSELDRRARRATSRLGDFDAHLEVELRAREEARGMLEDLRLWLLWELGEHGVAKVGDSDPGEDRVEALELQQSVENLTRRLEDEARQRRQLERDAMQAMEELEEDRQRLERDLTQLVEAHLRDSAEDEVERATAEERIDELEGALATQRTGASSSDFEQLQRQAERIADLSWDLESRESLVHWLIQELDPRVLVERDETNATCAIAVRKLPALAEDAGSAEDDVDPAELLHWLEARGGVPANGNAPWAPPSS